VAQPGRLAQSRWLVAGLLALVAALPRAIFPGLSEFKLDESTAVLGALDAIHRHAIPLQGQGSSVPGAAQGPLLYDLVAAVLAVAPDPRFVVMTIGLLNAASVGLTYLMCSPRFGPRVALYASILFAAGAWPIVFSRKIWPNDLLAPAAVVALWGLLRALDPDTRVPGLGRTWLAVAALVSLNFGAWPEAVIPAAALVVVPRTRTGWARWWSLAGLTVFAASLVPRVGDAFAILVSLTHGSARDPAFDVAPFSYIVQLGGTDAFRLLAGPSDGFVAASAPAATIDPVLHWLLLVGAAIAATRWGSSIVRRHQLLTVEGIVILWWIAPAVTAVDHGAIAVYVHHFVGTFPTQFILIAIAIDGIERGIRLVISRDTRIAQLTERSAGVDLTPVAVRDFGRASVQSGRPAISETTGLLGIGAVIAMAGVQLVTFGAYLQFIAAHPSGTFFGIPLDVSLAAAQQALVDRQWGPVEILSGGDQVGVDAEPTIFAALTDSADLIYVNANHTIVIPGAPTSTLLVSPDVRATARELIAPWLGSSGPLTDQGTIGGGTGFDRLAGHGVSQWHPDGWIDLNASLDDGSSFLGAILPRQTRGGQAVGLDVAWQVGAPPDRPAEQSVFAHLVADDGRPIADQDYSPLPLHAWEAGDVVVDRFSLGVPALTRAGRLWIDVGRYARPGVQPIRLLATDEAPGPTSLRLGPIAIPPNARPRGTFATTSVTFGNRIQLGGWRVMNDADGLRVTLRWQPRTQLTTRYTVFVHLLDEGGHIVAQNDSEPRHGQFPTSTWELDDVVTDSHQLSLAGVPDGQYQIEVGLYEATSGRRLGVANGNSDTIATVEVRASDQPS
jgi:hypothetical protein